MMVKPMKTLELHHPMTSNVERGHIAAQGY